MTPSEQTLPESTLSTRLQHFKDACAQQRMLETQIQELIEKGETVTISKVCYAEVEQQLFELKWRKRASHVVSAPQKAKRNSASTLAS